MKHCARASMIVLLVLCCALNLQPAAAQVPTPAALPPGIDLGLGALAYQANFNDSAAWPPVGSAFAANSQGAYHARSTGSDPVWGPSAAYAGHDYYAELSFDLQACGSRGTIYFVVRMSDPKVAAGNGFAYSVRCDGALEARRVFGGDLRADSSGEPGQTLEPGRHHIGVLSVGTTGRWFVDGREIGAFDNILMSQSGYVAFGLSGPITVDVQQLRIWTLAADALPAGTGKLLYDANFVTDPQWPRGLGDSAVARTADEVYLLETIPGTKPLIALSGHTAADVVVQLIFEPRQCTADAALGIVFRATYVFALQCDGHYVAGNVQHSGTWDRTGTARPIKPFSDRRNLAVMVRGSTARLFLDGKQVDTLAIPGAAQPGDTGIFAYSGSGAIQAGIRAFGVWSAA